MISQTGFTGHKTNSATHSTDTTTDIVKNSDIQLIDFTNAPVSVNILKCGGNTCCPSGKQNSRALGLKLQEKLKNVHLPAKMSIGVYGCTCHCPQMFVQDIGIVGTKNGWRLFAGGSISRQPRYPWQLARNLSTRQVIDTVDRIVAIFRTNNNSRLSALIESIGIENFKNKVFDRKISTK